MHENTYLEVRIMNEILNVSVVILSKLWCMKYGKTLK